MAIKLNFSKVDDDLSVKDYPADTEIVLDQDDVPEEDDFWEIDSEIEFQSRGIPENIKDMTNEEFAEFVHQYKLEKR